MNHIDRFYATVRREPVDRPCTWLGLPVPDAWPGLLAHFGAADARELAEITGDDIAPVELPYHSPTSDAIYAAFDFAQQGPVDLDHRTLTSAGFFAGQTDPACVEDFDWPDPSLYIDPEECRRAVAATPPGRAVLGVIWSAHFQDACAAFGMENALMAMYDTPEVCRAVIDRITDSTCRPMGSFTRRRRFIARSSYRQRFRLPDRASPRSRPDPRVRAPGTRRLIAQAKDHGPSYSIIPRGDPAHYRRPH